MDNLYRSADQPDAVTAPLASPRRQAPEPIRPQPGNRLNVGCGRNILAGWVNLDSCALPGVDVVADLDRCADASLPLEDDSCSQFLVSHVLEHLHHPLSMMQELWRIAAPGAQLMARTPYGASDDAWEDPTHVRPYFVGSFGYFSQPYYWRADYGYRGDWRCDKVALLVPRTIGANVSAQELTMKITRERNIVQEMVATLTAVKPARPPSRELLAAPRVTYQLV